ncbi:hypothetical protein CCACVL1_01967, partial [Corchorus capsularis]
ATFKLQGKLHFLSSQPKFKDQKNVVKGMATN